MCADFNFYLNRQGLRGLTGEKGDQGFSPYFTVEESTANQYRLRVHNENDSFVTENLRGNAIEIRNPDGNYIKYDHTTGDFYVDDADYATADSEGQIILATINDVVIGNETKAVTPALLLDSLSQILVNTDDNLTITQNQDNSLTEIKLADEVIHTNLKYAQNNNYLITGDIRYKYPIVVTKGTLDDTGRRGCSFSLNYNTSHFQTSNNSLALSNAITSYITQTRADLNSEISNRANADTEIRASIATERLERQTETSALNTVINDITNTMVTLNGYQTISNKTIDGKLNFRNPETYIMAESASDFTINANNYLYLQAKDNVGVYIGDSKANFNFTDEGNINVFTFADSTNYFLKQNTVTAGDNITIERDGKGIKISSTGGGGGAGDVTAAGNNTFTGVNTFEQNPIVSGLTLKNGNLSKQIYLNSLGRLNLGDSIQFGNVSISGGGANPTIKDESNDSYYLTQDSVEAGSNINISKTSKGISISSTSSGGAEIDDENVSTTKVFSSSRTSNLIGEVGNDLQDLTQRVNNIESLKVPNVVIVGEPLIQDGQVSGLDSNNHLQFPFILERQGRSWECNLSFTTGDDITTQQNIIDSRCSIALAVRNSDLVLALSSNGTTFNLGEHIMPDFLVQPDTTYYVRISYIDNMGYVLEADVAPIAYGSPHLSIGYPSTPLAATTMLIGSDGNSFDGTLDLNKWSLKVDEQLVWLGMDNVGQAVSANVSLSNINETGKKVIFDNSIKMEAGDNIDISDKISHTRGDLTINKNNANIYFSSSGWNYTTQPITYECLPKAPFVGYNFDSSLYSSISISGEIYNGTIEVSKDGVSWIALTNNATAGTNYKIGQNLSESYFEFSHIRITPVSSDYAQLGVEGKVTGIQLNYIGIPSVDSSIKVISCPAIGNINSLLDEINGEVI